MSVRDPQRIGQPPHAPAGEPASVAEQLQYEQSELLPEQSGSTVAGPPRPSGPAQKAQLRQSQPRPGRGRGWPTRGI
ncbi:hypothetical protein [Kitasatospora sp. NPDC051164]|uniref:hypothetical protein n=1 Tax=Kitasatospora sp. NPDC051164 TaxID=3364055 RepID=UPI00379DE3AC